MGFSFFWAYSIFSNLRHCHHVHNNFRLQSKWTFILEEDKDKVKEEESLRGEKGSLRNWTLIEKSNRRSSGSVGVSSEKAKDRSVMERPSYGCWVFFHLNYHKEEYGLNFWLNYFISPHNSRLE